MSLDYDKQLIPLAKALRKHATPQENHLWYDFPKGYTPRFQRQKAIGQYIADFYCEKARLVIELDGSQHFTTEGITRDQVRTAALAEHQLQVLRFTNHDIDQHFPAVCTGIHAAVQARLDSQK